MSERELSNKLPEPNKPQGERHSKIVKCDCGTKFVKSCPSKEVCDISKVKCPKCGELCN